VASSDPAERKEIASTGAYTMWSNTPDRAARLTNMHRESTCGENYHARRLFGQDVDLDSLTPQQWEAVRQARSAWYKALSNKGIRAKRLKQAQRLHAKARRIEAEVDDFVAEQAGDA